MSRARNCQIRIAGGAAALLFLNACATPATEVEVPTMPMHQALALAQQQGTAGGIRLDPAAHVLASSVSKGAPRPQLSPPDVRMAYLYEWVDAEGNKHFGEWIAIPIAGFDWIMSDGSRSAVDGSAAETAPAQERH
jgi:hypothetical protein